jgi:hypothetical protein
MKNKNLKKKMSKNYVDGRNMPPYYTLIYHFLATTGNNKKKT